MPGYCILRMHNGINAYDSLYINAASAVLQGLGGASPESLVSFESDIMHPVDTSRCNADDASLCAARSASLQQGNGIQKVEAMQTSCGAPSVFVTNRRETDLAIRTSCRAHH